MFLAELLAGLTRLEMRASENERRIYSSLDMKQDHDDRLSLIPTQNLAMLLSIPIEEVNVFFQAKNKLVAAVSTVDLAITESSDFSQVFAEVIDGINELEAGSNDLYIESIHSKLHLLILELISLNARAIIAKQQIES